MPTRGEYTRKRCNRLTGGDGEKALQASRGESRPMQAAFVFVTSIITTSCHWILVGMFSLVLVVTPFSLAAPKAPASTMKIVANLLSGKIEVTVDSSATVGDVMRLL